MDEVSISTDKVSFMSELYNKKLKPFSQKLRREMTKEEKHLWYDFLKKLPFTVNRQKILGDYIADFYIASKRTVIELDGSQHGWSFRMKADEIRDKWMQENGITVLRYTNEQINRHFFETCEDILHRLDAISSLKGM